MDQDDTWYGGRPRPRPHCARWGPSLLLLLRKNGTAPHPRNFRPMCVVHSQTAGWIKMALGAKVGLGPGHIVLHGDPADTSIGAQPQFWAHVCCGQMVAHLSCC